MAYHLQREMEKLKKMLLRLGGIVEESLSRSVEAFLDRDGELAREVIEGDRLIDRMEVEVEEECLKTLALYQPVAIDLRLICAVMRINNDLERAGDIAVNMAKRALAFSERRPDVKAPDGFSSAVEMARRMFKDSLDALVNLDVAAARAVCQADDKVDEACHRMHKEIKTRLREHPDQVDALCSMLMLPRLVERVADHATNIAEDVIYMVDGEIIRHGAHGEKNRLDGATRETKRS